MNLFSTLFPVQFSKIAGCFSADAIFRKLLLNSGYLFGANSVNLVLSFLQAALVARYLRSETYGVFILITTYATTVNQFVDSRVWEAAIKFVIQFLEKGDYAKATAAVKLCYLVDLATGTAAFTFVMITADWGARVFVKDPFAGAFIRLYSFAILFGIPTGTCSALLRISDRFDLLAYQNICSALLKLLGTTILFVFVGKSLTGLLAIYLSSFAVGMLLLLFFSKRISTGLNLTAWNEAPLSLLKHEIKGIFRFLMATNANAFFKLLQRNADTLLIGYFLGPVPVSYFRVARSLTDVMGFPINPLYAASYPEFTRLWHQGKVNTLRRLLRRLTFASSAAACSGLLMLLLFGKWIIRLTVGVEYLPALPVVGWLAFAVAIAVSTNFGHPVLLATGNAHVSLLAMGFGVVVQLSILLLFLPLVGVSGAGMAYLGFYAIWTVITVFGVSKVWKTGRLPVRE